MFDNNFQRNFKTECEIWLHFQPDRTKACILWISHTGQIVPIYDQSKDDLQHKLLILKIQQGMYIPLHQYLEKNRQCSRKLRIMLTGEVFRIGCDKLRLLSALLGLLRNPCRSNDFSSMACIYITAHRMPGKRRCCCSLAMSAHKVSHWCIHCSDDVGKIKMTSSSVP